MISPWIQSRKQHSNKNMLEILVLSTSFVILACGMDFATVDAASDGKAIPAIYWNISAPMFKQKSDHVQFVRIGQKMDIICPLRERNRPDGLYYFVLYKVKKEAYHSCNASQVKPLLTCDTPDHEKKYTFLFQDITPSPWGLTFKEKETYYFISTSDGTMGGMNNKKGGACTEKNMRMKISVTESDKGGTEPGNSGKDTRPRPRPPIRQDPPTPAPGVSDDNDNTYVKDDNDVWEDNGKGDNNGQSSSGELNSNGLVIGVVLGACAVLFIVLLGFLGYKVYKKRRHVKKYQSPGISASRAGTPQAQVTLLPISSHQAAQLRAHTTVSNSHHHHHHHHPLEIQDLRPPPPYNESILDHAGSTMEV